MPTDGLARYDHLSGTELLRELESMDSRRFPKNYETLRQEISARGPIRAPIVADHLVERYEALSYEERRRFRWACIRRIGMLLFQYQLFGGFIATIIASVVSASISGISGVNPSSLYQGITLVLLFLLIIASYWAFLRWMLKENVSDMQVAIIRSKAIQAQEKENASAAVSPDSALQRTEDS